MVNTKDKMECKQCKNQFKESELSIECPNCYIHGFDFEKNRLIKKFNNAIDKNEIYPTDIFPELSNFQIETINDLLLSHLKFPVDRLSAHISRKILDGIRDKLNKELSND